MIPFFLVPEGCWVGETGQYLVEFLRLTPYGEWNTAFLPGNLMTSLILGTPMHPGAESSEFIASVSKMILESKAATGAAAAKIRTADDLELMSTARNQSLALILTAAKKVAAGLAELGKPKGGPDNRAGLAFLSLDCVDYQHG